MFPSLAQETREEIDQLAWRYGQPLVQTVTLDAKQPFDPLSKKDRYGEVCMVVRRPNGRLLTMTKTFYPAGVYRLLTGGINHDERILTALLRETQEETSLQVEVRRFLALAAYRLANTGDHPIFYTFAFLLDEVGGTLHVDDGEEQVGGFLEIEPAELANMAERLEHVNADYSDQIAGRWQDWGKFRAVIHRLVWEAWPA